MRQPVRRKGSDGLTATQRQWAEGMARHGDALQAARDTGVAAPEMLASRLQRNETAIEAVNKLVLDRLPHLATLAVATIEGIMVSNKAKDADKLRAAGMVLDEVERRRKIDGSFGKELHEMTGEELVAAMNRTRAKLEAIDAEIIPINNVLD